MSPSRLILRRFSSPLAVQAASTSGHIINSTAYDTTDLLGLHCLVVFGVERFYHSNFGPLRAGTCYAIERLSLRM